MSHGSEIRTIRQLVGEIRDETPPELDWDAMERQLLDRAGKQEQRRKFPRLSRYKLAAVGLGAAAAVALSLGLFRTLDHHVPTVPDLAVDSDATDRLDGTALDIGQRIVAGTSPIQVEHAGRASWTLQPHSSARLLAGGEQVNVELEFGAVVASVVPTHVAESFAIHAGRTRVAVHGTVFSVELRDGNAHVQVTQGTVAVGSVDGRDRAWLLSAPASGRFTLDGRRLDTLEMAPDPNRISRARSRRAAALAPSAHPAPSADAPAQTSVVLPLEPEPLTVQLATDRIADVVRRCFTEHTRGTGVVSVSASSSMTLQLGPDGRVQKLEFDPPLAPAVQQCSESSVGHIQVEPSQRGVTATRVVHLG